MIRYIKKGNIYYENNLDYFNKLVELISKSPKGYTILLDKNLKYRYLLDWINFSLPKLANNIYQIRTKCYWILNGLIDFPICPVCGRQDNYIGKNIKLNEGYPISCCKKCMYQNNDRTNKIHATNIAKYGGITPFCSKDVIEKAQDTMLKRYGAKFVFSKESSLHEHLFDKLSEKIGRKITNPSQVKEIAEKAKQTKIQKFGPAGFNVEKKKATCKKRYGVEHYSSTDEYKKKYRKTCLERYGVENVFQTEECKEKSRQTCNERYGVEYYSQTTEHTEQVRQTSLEKYGVEHYSKTDECKERVKNTYRKKYGVDYFTQTSKYLEKSKDTCIKKYGTEFYVQTSEYKERVKNTCMDRYGKEFYTQTDEYKERAKQTYLQKYGVEYPAQNRDIMLKSKRKYIYNNTSFDSSPELALYIYLEDNNIDFEYQPDVFFWYEYHGKKSRYFPDFRIGNHFIEIKGKQFLKEDGTWQCPYDHSFDNKYEAKHQCAIANDVKIMYNSDFQKYIDYVKNKYGKDWLQLFRNQTQK